MKTKKASFYERGLISVEKAYYLVVLILTDNYNDQLL